MNKIGHALVIVFMPLFVVPVCAREEIDPAGGLVLANDYVRFEFEPFGMGLAKMTDLKTECNHIQAVSGKHLLWEVALGVGRQIYTITNNYRPCSNAYIETLPNGRRRAVMEWNDMRWWNEDGIVSVKVTVGLPGDSGIAEWRICVENRSDYWGTWSVLFPIINGFPASGKYDIARPSFARGGVLLKNHTETIRARYPGATWSTQFMSFNRGENAVYLATGDSRGRAKDFVVEPIKDLHTERYPIVFEGRRHKKYQSTPGERAYLIHYPDNMGQAGSDCPDYYPVEFGVYQGGWLEAAHRYRPWALKQKWAAKGLLSQRTDVPDKIKNIGVWIRDRWEWNQAGGSPGQMNKPLLDAAKRLQVPVGLQWYHWHHNEFDNDYPHFIPAKEKFEQRVGELTAHGILVMPYINGSSADMNISDFDRFAPHAVLDEAGGIRHHYYSNRAGRLLSMCGKQTFWQDTIVSLVQDIFTLYGVDGIYVDQVAGLYHELCFAPNHNHPLGGGTYWADGNSELLGKIKDIASKNNTDCVVTSEGAAEVFLDVLDGNLFWSQPSETEIPMMSVVYSGYTIFFGSPCDYKKTDRFFIYAQGRAFIDGRQNGWMDLGMFKPQYHRKVEYLKKCGRYRVAARKFLTFGRLWGPIEPSNDITEFAEEGFGWAFYEKTRTTTLPAAQANLWQAEDGSLGVFLVNYVDRKTSFAYTVDPSKYGLKAKEYRINEITPSGVSPVTIVTGTIKRLENLEPQQIKVIEITPSG